MKRHSQQGSALLIVLGFLSFMVVSAVAFAIWMRTERLPSSALRRNVANNYLVKAALAQAMSRVDDAIRSHAFPGAYTNQPNSAYRDGHNCIYDWWEARVFMPPDPEGKETTSGDPHSRYAPVTKTVSVLNLEALGYLPPAIANDVRLLSRSSWAAQWDYFNFDAGRYAFCAVNVSDMLDITKIAADSPRTSAAATLTQQGDEKPKPSRFSLAYLFRNSTSAQSDNFSNPSGMSTFDQRVHTAPGQGQWSTAPLVSLMDYNLSVGSEPMGPLWSPFFKLACGDNNTKYFYGATGSDNAYVKGAERQPFVTSSWFPSSDYAKSNGSADTPLDISKSPPFSPSLLMNDNANLMSVLTDTSPLEFWKAAYQYGHAFCILDQFTLFDYLDKNDVPLSLAMPCAERVPMITSLAPVGTVQMEFTPMKTVGKPDTSQGDWRETSEANIKITANGLGLSSTILFPFNDGGNGQRQNKNYTAQAFARLVFVADSAAGGAGGAASSVSLRSNGFAKNLRPMSPEEWTSSVGQDKQFALEAGSGGGTLSRTPAPNCMVVTLPSQGAGAVTFPANIQNEQSSWKNTLLQLGNAGQIEKPILRKVEVYELVAATSPGGDPTRGPKKAGQTYYEILLNPFDTNGEILDFKNQYQDGRIPETTFNTTFSSQYTIRPYLVTWARVMQDDGKTVDVVPATYEDDKVLNNIDNALFNFPDINNYYLGNTPSDLSGTHALPIMRFQGGQSFTYADVNSATAPQANDWVDKSCYAIDPRFNWAPENWWFESSDANPTGQKWYDSVFGNGPNDDTSILNKLVQDEFGGSVKGRGDRATDPFMFVSNLGYIQSVGELAFLPRLSDMREDGLPASVLGDSKQTIDGGSHAGALYDGKPRDRSTVTTVPCALAAWKSYQSFRTNPTLNTFEFGANLYRRGLVNPSQGFYVNPFTQSQEVMLAALANTPLNYWVAGTNYTAEGKTEFKTFDAYKRSMFSDNGVGVQFRGRDLNKVATFLRRRFEDLASMIEAPHPMGEVDLYVYQRVWEDMFDALDWSGTLDHTVEDVYEDLMDYYNKGNSNNRNYRNMYMQGSGNGYSDLNHFVRGGGKKDFNVRIKLHKDRAVHKEDFGLKADPLRGQYAGDTGDTSCYRDFYDVDRKFLHSYWRDCFANRQQLFLIFVRAESTALGGTGEGTPAQQGGRAVALVWRDPMPPTGEDVLEHENNQYQPRRRPHKMRILFYRQFD